MQLVKLDLPNKGSKHIWEPQKSNFIDCIIFMLSFLPQKPVSYKDCYPFWQIYQQKTPSTLVESNLNFALDDYQH